MVAGPEREGQVRVLSLCKGLARGGVEKLLVSLARVRDAERFHYTVGYTRPDLADLVPELIELGVEVRCLSATGYDVDLRWVAALREWLAEERFDIVHLHLRYPATFGRLAVRSLPRARRPKVVFTEHNVWGHDVLLTRFTNALTFLLDDADVAVSPEVMRSLPSWARRRTRVIVHGLDRAEIEAARNEGPAVRAELGIAPEEVVVGTVANFRPQKGFPLLVEAARELAAAGPPARFVIVGSGPEEERVRKLIVQAGVADRFVLTGARADAIRVASAFDVFVMSSLFEGFPVAVMEALALGLPIVATAVGGIPDAIRDGVEGLLVPPGDSAALARALRRLICDAGLRERMASAALATGAGFDIRVAARELESLYLELASGHGP